MNQQRHLIAPDAVGRRRLGVEDGVNPLKLQEVVARPQRPKLAQAALTGPCGDRLGIRGLEPALGLREVKLLLASDPKVFQQRTRA